MNRLLLIFVLIVASVASSEAFFSWLFGLKNSNRDEEATQPEKGGLLTSETVPFDMKTTDDSFLASAQLSALDTCHHNVRTCTTTVKHLVMVVECDQSLELRSLISLPFSIYNYYHYKSLTILTI